MSQPENRTSGRYFLRTGKNIPSAVTSTPIARSSVLLPSSPSGATFTTPVPILLPPTPLFRPLSPPPNVHPDAAADTSSSSPPSPSPDVAADFSDSDTDMAGSSLVPSPFTGRQHEDVAEFLKNFELWATFRTMTEEAKLAALPLLLKDSAAVWYNTQTNDTRQDFAALKEVLKNRYGPSMTDAWKRAAELWQMKQLPQQSIDDFLTMTQQAAQKLDVTAEQTFMVALNGLRPNIRQHVVQHDPTTIDDLRKWGRLTEMSQEDHHDAERHLRETVQELAAVKDELKKLQLTNLSAINSTRQRSRSPTPHRVTFSNPPVQQTRVDDYMTSSQRHHQPPQFDDYHQPTRHFNDYASPQSSHQYQPQRQHHNQYPPSSVTRHQEQRRQPTTWRPMSNYSTPACGNVGVSMPLRGFVRAKGLTCYNCSKRGHLSSVCRAGRGQFNSH